MESPRCARLLLLLLLPTPLLLLLLTPPGGKAAIITGVCGTDRECASGTCCAVSTWIRGLRVCTPLGRLGSRCSPYSHRVPYKGFRLRSICPCMPSLSCIQTSASKIYTCLFPS
ncbi:prokineticin-2 [Erinaceus europaeus]|uniref:Prokineticin-2 n=1 Tax=Erinaceus europaeus TaxID=9365 RepID=A0A1S3WKX9_ERIEU|nr:prokineticin-2 [Erinaceus europaeus]